MVKLFIIAKYLENDENLGNEFNFEYEIQQFGMAVTNHMANKSDRQYL